MLEQFKHMEMDNNFVPAGGTRQKNACKSVHVLDRLLPTWLLPAKDKVARMLRGEEGIVNQVLTLAITAVLIVGLGKASQAISFPPVSGGAAAEDVSPAPALWHKMGPTAPLFFLWATLFLAFEVWVATRDGAAAIAHEFVTFVRMQKAVVFSLTGTAGTFLSFSANAEVGFAQALNSSIIGVLAAISILSYHLMHSVWRAYHATP